MTTEAEARMSDALERVLARLDSLERKVDALAGIGPEAASALNTLAARLPAIADAAGTTVAYAWSEAEKRGIDPIATGMRAADVLPPLLEKALARTELASAALEASAGVDPAVLTEVIQKSAPLMTRLARVLSRPELAALIDAVDGATLGVAAQATSALVESRAQPAAPVGPIKAFFALGDPDVQRAVGFGLAVAQKFGQRLA